MEAEVLVTSLVILSLLSSLSVVDRRISFFGGISWFVISSQVILPTMGPALFILGIGVGMFLLIVGVVDYYPE